ncbi:MAG: hypothetical protein KIS92_15505 [Planctomycetota bacterium]|nr:hypothetical protein [Planctomycetota bacterium]
MGGADTATLRPVAPVAQGAAIATGAVSGGWVVRGLKLLLGILLIPACVGFSLAFHDVVYDWCVVVRVSEIFHLDPSGIVTCARWLAGGMVAFAVVGGLLWRPVLVYVFAHELVHALATWLSLGTVTNFRASVSGGQVTTSKTNTFIRLSPYFVPLYALLSVGVWLALDAWWRPLGDYRYLLAGLIGCFWAFHVGFTLWSLNRGQSDLKPDGWLFSIVLIYLANLLMAAALLGFALGGKPACAWDAVKANATKGYERSLEIYRNLGRGAERLVRNT